MKLLVIGSGGREHALVWKLAQSFRTTEIFCAPGNPGMAAERLKANGKSPQTVPIAADDLPGLLAFASSNGINLTVVGPDNPLALGIVDFFQDHGLRIWGPKKRAALFESSKAFSQEFMDRHGVPTALSGTFEDATKARDFVRRLNGRCAVKADGLALGKGVLLPTSIAEADAAIDEIMVKRSFGDAGAKIVIQEFLEGIEISMHALCDGRTFKLFPGAQDHKRALDGDQGLNTGGMGTYSPVPFVTDAELFRVGQRLLNPWLQGCASDGIDFRGILFPGVMLTKNGPRVIEFNARFGDPEAQVYLTRLENDLLDLLLCSVEGSLATADLHWSTKASVCVVLASGGYPGPITKGKVIHGLDKVAELPDVKVFHAGTAMADGKYVTNGGRVLGVTAWAGTLAEAKERAYAACQHITFEGMQYRKDIAAKGLGRN